MCISHRTFAAYSHFFPSSAHTLPGQSNHQDVPSFRKMRYSTCSGSDNAAEGLVPATSELQGEIGPYNKIAITHERTEDEKSQQKFSVLMRKGLHGDEQGKAFQRKENNTSCKLHEASVCLEGAEAKAWQFHQRNWLGNDQGNIIHCSNVKLLISREESVHLSAAVVHTPKKKKRETKKFITALPWLRYPWSSGWRCTGEEDSYYIS